MSNWSRSEFAPESASGGPVAKTSLSKPLAKERDRYLITIFNFPPSTTYFADNFITHFKSITTLLNICQKVIPFPLTKSSLFWRTFPPFTPPSWKSSSAELQANIQTVYALLTNTQNSTYEFPAVAMAWLRYRGVFRIPPRTTPSSTPPLHRCIHQI